MRNRLTKLATSVVALIAVTSMTLLATSTLAQQQNRPVYVPPALERREAEMARQREMREREILRESLGKRPVRAANLRYVQLVIAQVQQDFERIQIARNGIVRAASAGNALDYKFISDVAGEIKKRASRLEGNLALPEPEEDQKSRSKAGELNEVQIKIIPEDTTAYAAYMTGALDTSGVPPANRKEVMASGSPLNKQLVRKNELTTFGLEFNEKEKPWDDVRVRQAFGTAFDRKAYIEGVLQGVGQPTTS